MHHRLRQPAPALSKLFRGFTLLETLVYVAILATVTALTTATLVTMLKPGPRVRAAQALNAGAIDTLERLSREIRNSYAIDDLGSSFAVDPGRLALQTLDSGVPETRTFYLASSTLMINNNGIPGALVTSGADVTSLIFYKLSTAISQGVRIELELSTSTSSGVRTERFYTTVMLRDSYD